MEDAGEADQTTHVRVLKRDREKLVSIKKTVGFKTLAWVIHMLLQEKAQNIADVASVMAGNVPVVLTGKPLSGKTYFVRQKLLPSLRDNPVLVIDCHGEYTELKNIGYDIYGLNFKEFKEQVRFVPSAQSRIAETEIESIFSHLDMKRDVMADWIIIVEEANTFKNVSAFVKFLYSSRHVCRKAIGVTPQTDAFTGLVTLTVCH